MHTATRPGGNHRGGTSGVSGASSAVATSDNGSSDASS